MIDLPINFDGVLLPKSGIDPGRWAVIACDQFTGNPEYWRRVEEIARGVPSAYHLILPEIYLSDDDSGRIAALNRAMTEYLDKGYFTEYRDCAILAERRTPFNARRLGLIFSVDLEAYDCTPGNKAAIRATEGTIAARIPPRAAIRRDAPLELPHVMLLFDDPLRTVTEPLYERLKSEKPLYDFELNMNGGHLTGRLVRDTDALCSAFKRLIKPDGLLFAVGDGNHSLASAKACWERLKADLSPAERAAHPARYALVEAVNIHDDGLQFEPIHRIVYGADPMELARGLTELKRGLRADGGAEDDPVRTIAAVQAYIDEYLRVHGGEVDYIHGAAELRAAAKLGAARHPAAIEMPRIKKDAFFELTARHGILPRKAFSMGEAEEKRYYFEARRIR
jgi:hypothetical protein